MRIQHNIAAMNAYRNYNNNTRALSKNLEKLSSGYKINRAGDDAAGLAISEKMRAQITGLNAAQKNVKDGVSLVKTAEGAMQEIQDMLNRMDYLATQSANGTYDNEVDRANLQKEVDNLKTEINRIADSANFNGIKLLDGSLDANKLAIDATTTETKHDVTVDMSVGGALPGVGTELGVDTVLHQESVSKTGSEFSINFHDFEFSNGKGDEMTVTIGEGDNATTITLRAKKDTSTASSAGVTNAALTGAALATTIISGASSSYDVMINGKSYTGGNITIGGQEFKLEAVTGNDTPGIKFTQVNPPKDASEEVNPAMKVTVKGDIAAKKAVYSFNVGTGMTIGANSDVFIGDEKLSVGGTAVSSTATDYAAFINANSKNFTATVDNGAVIIKSKTGGVQEKPDISFQPKVGTATTIAAAATVAGSAATAASASATYGAGTVIKYNGTTLGTVGVTGSTTFTSENGQTYKIEFSSGTAVTVTAAISGAAGNDVLTFTATTNNNTTDAVVTTENGANAIRAEASYDVSSWTDGQIKIGNRTFSYGDTIDGEQTTFGNNTYNISYDGQQVKVTLADDPTGTVAAPGNDVVRVAQKETIALSTLQKGADAVDGKFGGDYNVSTTDIKHVTAAGQKRLASTYFDLTEDMVREGSQIRIGRDTYTFTTDTTKTNAIDISSGDLSTIAKNLTDAAANNATWTVGHDGSRITLTESMTNDGKYTIDGNGKVSYNGDYDLRTEDGIKASLGFKGVSYTTTETTEAQEGGKPLTLQIGDTSDDFNQMKVSVGDMHVSAMKLTDEETGESTSIADIDISTQDGAAKAVDVIKASINYVSSVRGDLGAIQNRLEHTQNNLSVMAENIQDAESTIRDTDVAEEMMSYVKNNILVQSAQAMLAQANQLPQGVLQLLG